MNARRPLVQRGAVVGEVEAKAVGIGQPAVAEAPEKIVHLAEALAFDQQIEIGAGTECRMGVDGFGEGRPLERDHRDALPLEGLEESPELAAEDQLAGGAVDEVAV